MHPLLPPLGRTSTKSAQTPLGLPKPHRPTRYLGNMSNIVQRSHTKHLVLNKALKSKKVSEHKKQVAAQKWSLNIILVIQIQHKCTKMPRRVGRTRTYGQSLQNESKWPICKWVTSEPNLLEIYLSATKNLSLAGICCRKVDILPRWPIYKWVL